MTSDKDVSADFEAMASAVGKFIMNFNGLEDRLDDVIGLLLNDKDVARGVIVGGAIMFSNKRKLINALIQHLGDDKAVEAYDPFDKRLEEINAMRNDLAHGEQWYDFDGNMRQRRARLTDKGFDPKHTSYSPDNILEWTGKIIDLETELWNFVKEFVGKETVAK